MELKKALIVPDMHIPYHHRKATNLMLSVAKNFKPDEIIFLGDVADMYSISSHPKDPRMPLIVQKEVDEVNNFLDLIDREFMDAKKTYIGANHEWRLERYLQNHAPALYGMISCQELFKINQRPGWRWVKYGADQRYQILKSDLYARHEPLASVAKTTASRASCSLVYGHVHRIEHSQVRTLNGKIHKAFSVGWLGDARKDEVFGYCRNEWALGFGLVYIDQKNGNFYDQTVHILPNITCVVDGKLYK